MEPMDATVEPRLAGDSAEQRAAERVLIETLGADLGVVFGKSRRRTAEGATAELDGVCEEPPILVEAWAHQGPPRSAQKHKVMTDTLKLVWAESVFFPAGARKILAFADEEAAAHFRRGSWMAAAIAHFGIEVRVVPLPDEQRAQIRTAQERQFR